MTVIVREPGIDTRTTRKLVDVYNVSSYPKGLTWADLLLVARNLAVNLQRGRRAFKIGERHYDIGNDLYEAFLDPEMVYSCAFFTPEARSLERLHVAHHHDRWGSRKAEPPGRRHEDDVRRPGRRLTRTGIAGHLRTPGRAPPSRCADGRSRRARPTRAGR